MRTASPRVACCGLTYSLLLAMLLAMLFAMHMHTQRIHAKRNVSTSIRNPCAMHGRQIGKACMGCDGRYPRHACACNARGIKVYSSPRRMTLLMRPGRYMYADVM